MHAEVYEALRSVNIPENRAIKVAVALSSRKQDEIYEALRSINVSEDKAIKAAEALSNRG